MAVINDKEVLSVTYLGVTGGNSEGTVSVADQHFNPDSINAQSGKAVAEAVEPKADWAVVQELLAQKADIETITYIGTGVKLDFESNVGSEQYDNISGTWKVIDFRLENIDAEIYINLSCGRADEDVPFFELGVTGVKPEPTLIQNGSLIKISHNGTFERDTTLISITSDEWAKSLVDKVSAGEVPKLFVGTKISSTIPGAIVMCAEKNAISCKYKVGDLYFNTDEQRCYQCVYVKFTTHSNNTLRYNTLYHDWIGLNYQPDTSYNPESLNAQSGLAVAEAVKYKANVEKELFYDGDYMIIGGVIVDGVYKLINVDAGTTAVVFVFEPNNSETSPLCVELLMTDRVEWASYGKYIGYNFELVFDKTSRLVVVSLLKDVSYKADKSAIGDIETALDEIKALQESILGGE